jgi:hypothetical protein
MTKRVKYRGQDVAYALQDAGYEVHNCNKNRYRARNNELDETVMFQKGRLCKVAYLYLRKVFSRWGVVLPVLSLILAVVIRLLHIG